MQSYDATGRVVIQGLEAVGEAAFADARHVLAAVVTAAATLLGVNKDALAHALTTRSRVMREGVIVSPLNVRAAVENR